MEGAIGRKYKVINLPEDHSRDQTDRMSAPLSYTLAGISSYFVGVALVVTENYAVGFATLAVGCALTRMGKREIDKEIQNLRF